MIARKLVRHVWVEVRVRSERSSTVIAARERIMACGAAQQAAAPDRGLFVWPGAKAPRALRASSAAFSARGGSRTGERQCVGRTARSRIGERRGLRFVLPRIQRKATALLETLTLSVGRRTQKRGCFLTLRVGNIFRSCGGSRQLARATIARRAASRFVTSGFEVAFSENSPRIVIAARERSMLRGAAQQAAAVAAARLRPAPPHSTS